MQLWSPSSRRAWIEILVAREVKRAALVALLAEGVDRNWDCYEVLADDPVVALLAEGVDRNKVMGYEIQRPGGRPPRGGRG